MWLLDTNDSEDHAASIFRVQLTSVETSNLAAITNTGI
jgi:hypothetical protein